MISENPNIRRSSSETAEFDRFFSFYQRLMKSQFIIGMIRCDENRDRAVRHPLRIGMEYNINENDIC